MIPAQVVGMFIPEAPVRCAGGREHSPVVAFPMLGAIFPFCECCWIEFAAYAGIVIS